MSINENIYDFATSDGNGDGTYTITRRVASTVLLGRVTPGAASTFSVTASVQPANGADLVVVPEGQRNGDMRKMFVDVELRATAGSPDTVVIGSGTYAIVSVSGPWELDGDVHWEAIAARQDVP